MLLGEEIWVRRVLRTTVLVLLLAVLPACSSTPSSSPSSSASSAASGIWKPSLDRACNGCLIGNPFSKIFNDENWANINNDQGQRDFMLKMNEARVAKCRQAGFDAVEFDVVEAYNSSYRTVGWHISPQTQLIFNK